MGENRKMNAGDRIKIGSCELKNRITMAPTVKFDYTDDSGLASEKHIAHYRERAEGGFGLICVEATAVTPEGRFCRTQMGLWNDAQAESHKPIAESCHRAGCVALIQLNHAGYQSGTEFGVPMGPSAMKTRGFAGENETRSMSLGEIAAVQEAFVLAAVRAKKAGYDGVQLHGCHGYLINQFVSPLTNHRTDAYGGPVENRVRFGREIIEGIRRECGPDFLISVRTTGYEKGMETPLAAARAYIAAGCNYLQVSSGWDFPLPAADETAAPVKISDILSLGVKLRAALRDGQSASVCAEQGDGPDAASCSDTKAGERPTAPSCAEQNVTVPVSGVGGLFTPEDIRAVLEAGLLDTVDLGRAALADPGIARAVLDGGDYVKCYQCAGGCHYGPFQKHICPAQVVWERKRG